MACKTYLLDSNVCGVDSVNNLAAEAAFPSKLYAATVSIGDATYPLLLFYKMLGGAHRSLADCFDIRIVPLDDGRGHKLSAVATSAKGFFRNKTLVVVHADLALKTRPWKNIPPTK